MTTLTGTDAAQQWADAKETAIQLREVVKTYRGNGTEVHALAGVSLQVRRGTFLAVMGPSGSGKSTLLHCAAGLDAPTSGKVYIGDTEITGMNETKRTVLRRNRIGFVFQAYNLVPSLTIEHNITLPLRLAGKTADREWMRALVDKVGIGDKLHRRPAELSGGQQQRAAIARSLIARPDVVFADEPTGALDLETATSVLDLLRQLVADLGQTVVMVTHDPNAAAWAQETLVVADGRIDTVLREPTADELAHRLTQLRRG